MLLDSSADRRQADVMGGKAVHRLAKGLLVGLMMVSSGCHYYEEYRVLKSKADVQEEHAELLKAYRLCLAKYQDDSPKAKELCGPYTQSLREIEVKHQQGR
jgi:uncharacterized protein YciW